MKTVKKTLPGISASAWEHPADSAALAAVKQIPALDEVLRRFVRMTTEKSLRLVALASSVRVSELQFPKLNRLLDEACMILDAPERPELFVSQSPVLNAGAVGVDRPFITLNSSLLGQLSDDEMLAVIGHELGHILSGHVLYKTLLWLLLKVSTDVVPVSKLVLTGLITALREWDRRSEMSADRAGLLVTQDIDVSFTVLMKVAGGSYPSEMSLEEFLRQAADYGRGGDLADSMHKLLNLIGESHPFAVLRLAELKSWYDSGSYSKVLEGSYARRGGEREGGVRGAFERAAGSYQEELNRSEDPLAKVAREVGKQVQSAGQQLGKQAEELLKGLFGGQTPFGGSGPFKPNGPPESGTPPQPDSDRTNGKTEADGSARSERPAGPADSDSTEGSPKDDG